MESCLPHEERKLIERDLQAHSTAILALKAQRNRLVPIGSLPPEVICRIFAFVKAAEGRHSYSFDGKPYCKGPPWIKVSHVCAHWREVAINLPSLWVDPPLENSSWLAEMLIRSKPAGLIIDANLACISGLKVITALKDVLQKHGSRFKHLSIWGLPYESQHILEHLPTSALRLERLRIKVSSPYRQSENSKPIPSVILTDTENLRHLELSNCNAQWTAYVLCGITHLKIHSIEPSSRPTLPQLMNALGSMTKLESLHLTDFLDLNQSREDSCPPVHLSHLREVDITSSIGEIEALFRCISFTRNATVNITASGSDDYDADVSSALSSLGRIYSNPSSALTLKTLVLKGVERDDDPLLLKLFSEGLKKFEYTDHPQLLLKFCEKTRDGAYASIDYDSLLFHFARSGIPLDGVTHAHLRTPALASKTLAHTLGALPALSFVRAEDGAAQPFVDALEPGPDGAPLAFARLVSMTVQARFRAPFGDGGLETDGLRDCILARHERGATLKKLSLVRCTNLNDEDVGMMEEDLWEEGMRVRVHWDHSVHEDWYEEDPLDRLMRFY